jgi:hypothetical protein
MIPRNLHRGADYIELSEVVAVDGVRCEPVSDLLFPDNLRNTGIFALSELFQVEGHVEFKAVSVH